MDVSLHKWLPVIHYDHRFILVKRSSNIKNIVPIQNKKSWHKNSIQSETKSSPEISYHVHQFQPVFPAWHSSGRAVEVSLQVVPLNLEWIHVVGCCTSIIICSTHHTPGMSFWFLSSWSTMALPILRKLRRSTAVSSRRQTVSGHCSTIRLPLEMRRLVIIISLVRPLLP